MNKFNPANLPVFICSHIYQNTKPVLLVSHEDGDWQFLCGEGHDKNEKPKVVCVSHLVERDPTLNEIADIPEDYEAERSHLGADWIITKVTDEE